MLQQLPEGDAVMTRPVDWAESSLQRPLTVAIGKAFGPFRVRPGMKNGV